MGQIDYDSDGTQRQFSHSNMRTRIFDGQNEAQVDASGALEFIPIEHTKVHEGDFYSLFHSVEDQSDEYGYIIQTGDINNHVVFKL